MASITMRVSPAPITYAQYQPIVSAIVGTARPASSVATGIEQCFNPNARP